MAFTNYKSIADVLASFPLHYQEQNFIESVAFECDEYFISRLNTVVQEGIVFNSEYAICENIISPILTEVWRAYISDFLIWSHQPNIVKGFKQSVVRLYERGRFRKLVRI